METTIPFVIYFRLVQYLEECSAADMHSLLQSRTSSVSDPVKPFGLLDASKLNVIVHKFGNQNIHLLHLYMHSYYKEKHYRYSNFHTFLLPKEHIPNASIQLGIQRWY